MEQNSNFQNIQLFLPEPPDLPMNTFVETIDNNQVFKDRLNIKNDGKISAKIKDWWKGATAVEQSEDEDEEFLDNDNNDLDVEKNKNKKNNNDNLNRNFWRSLRVNNAKFKSILNTDKEISSHKVENIISCESNEYPQDSTNTFLSGNNGGPSNIPKFRKFSIKNFDTPFEQKGVSYEKSLSDDQIDTIEEEQSNNQNNKRTINDLDDNIPTKNNIKINNNFSAFKNASHLNFSLPTSSKKTEFCQVRKRIKGLIKAKINSIKAETRLITDLNRWAEHNFFEDEGCFQFVKDIETLFQSDINFEEKISSILKDIDNQLVYIEKREISLKNKKKQWEMATKKFNSVEYKGNNKHGLEFHREQLVNAKKSFEFGEEDYKRSITNEARSLFKNVGIAYYEGSTEIKDVSNKFVEKTMTVLQQNDENFERELGDLKIQRVQAQMNKKLNNSEDQQKNKKYVNTNKKENVAFELNDTLMRNVYDKLPEEFSPTKKKVKISELELEKCIKSKTQKDDDTILFENFNSIEKSIFSNNFLSEEKKKAQDPNKIKGNKNIKNIFDENTPKLELPSKEYESAKQKEIPKDSTENKNDGSKRIMDKNLPRIPQSPKNKYFGKNNVQSFIPSGSPEIPKFKSNLKKREVISNFSGVTTNNIRVSKNENGNNNNFTKDLVKDNNNRTEINPKNQSASQPNLNYNEPEMKSNDVEGKISNQTLNQDPLQEGSALTKNHWAEVKDEISNTYHR